MSSEGLRGSSEEDSDDGLWNEFENTAQAVAHLFRGGGWRNLQTAAASATQLYKSGLETKKRSFDKGFHSGRQALAKEIYALCRYSTKIEVEEVIRLLSSYALLPSEHSHGLSPTRRQRNASNTTSGDNAAVNLFQQALCPPPHLAVSSSPQRSPELNSFLQNQVYRHRKRPHSPAASNPNGSSYDSVSHTSNYLNKRFKRL